MDFISYKKLEVLFNNHFILNSNYRNNKYLVVLQQN